MGTISEGVQINMSTEGRARNMKSSPSRLTREHARELLVRIDSAIDDKSGREMKEALVKALNSSIPTYSWVGLYSVNGNDLVLDAWSGPAATEHTSIPIGHGICGFAAKAGRTEIVSDVSKDPRYMQCFLSTKSEIVVPVLKDGAVIGEIDIDSDQLDGFSSLDRELLEAVAKKVGERW